MLLGDAVLVGTVKDEDAVDAEVVDDVDEVVVAETVGGLANIVSNTGLLPQPM